MGLLAGEDGGLVAVHGLAAFAWDAGDQAGRRLAGQWMAVEFRGRDSQITKVGARLRMAYEEPL